MAAKSPLACFVALQLTQLGHFEPDIVERGFSLINFLVSNGRYDHVMECLIHVAPVFFANVEKFWTNPTLVKCIEIISAADQTYFKMAKDLIAAEFPGPVLKEFGNMVVKQIADFQR